MLELLASIYALVAVLTVAISTWLYSAIRGDVSIVDSLWSMMFLICLLVYLAVAESSGPRSVLVTALVTIWALRLSAHITVRNHGKPEDHRYQAIRKNNEPGFSFKSIYIVFLLQGFLAWVICLPALAAVSGQTPPGPLDYAGTVLWLAGMFFEVVGDHQLSRFRSQPDSRNRVLDTGLWRYTRHPNYFGEAIIWWGFYLIALSAGAWWAIFSPLLMTFLLLRVSGVVMLEKDIHDRRPAYREYIKRTNAFFPGRPRSLAHKRNLTSVITVCIMTMAASPLAVASEGVSSGNEPEVPTSSMTWRFRVWLDDREIGYHHFYLVENGDFSQVRSEANFEYKLLFVKLYEYEHENRETWNGDCLQSIDSRTDANGTPHAISGRRIEGKFALTSSESETTLPECIMSFAYWNPLFLEQGHLLNTQNGEFLQIEVSPPTFEELEVQGQRRASYRYRLAAGPLNLDLWYSTDRQWLGLESETEGGRTLRYELL